MLQSHNCSHWQPPKTELRFGPSLSLTYQKVFLPPHLGLSDLKSAACVSSQELERSERLGACPADSCLLLKRESSSLGCSGCRPASAQQPAPPESLQSLPLLSCLPPPDQLVTRSRTMSGVEWKLHGRVATTRAAEGSTWLCSCCGSGASFSLHRGLPTTPGYSTQASSPIHSNPCKLPKQPHILVDGRWWRFVISSRGRRWQKDAA